MAVDVLVFLRDTTVQLLLSPGSVMSLWSLLAAALIAAGAVVARRRGRPIRWRVLRLAITPRSMSGASMRTDIAFTLLNVFVTGAAIGWAIVSHLTIADIIVRAAGGAADADLPHWLVVTISTAGLWLAYEFAYFIDHLLSHRVAWLWSFHKVHHTAETMSPLTIFRVHPVDSLVFYNLVAVITGLMAGGLRLWLGEGAAPATVGGANLIAFMAVMTVKHLHHSHAWIAFTGPLGRVFMSPAHHQIHHSIAPEHHDRNFGDMLAVFDWAYGSLKLPSAKREPLRFGVAGVGDPHSLSAALLMPFGEAVAAHAPARDHKPAAPSPRGVGNGCSETLSTR